MTDPTANNTGSNIFLSSTSKDLIPYRDTVKDALEELRQSHTRMETFVAMPETPVKECLKLVTESRAVVVILAHRYGWVPTVEEGGDGHKSITWLEVEQAHSLGKPVFAFVVDENYRWPGARESDRLNDAKTNAEIDKVVSHVKGLQDFKSRIPQISTPAFFDTPDDLARKVSSSIANWLLKPIPDSEVTTRVPDPVITYWAGRPSSDAGLYGRDDEMKELDEYFENGSTAVISAGPGIGKSRLAAEWSAVSGKHGFWVPGGNTVNRTLATLAPQLKLEGTTDEELADDVRAWFSRNGYGLLWVVDDLSDLGQVVELSNACGDALLLVTTRNSGLGVLVPGVKRMALEHIDSASSIELLRSRGSEGDDRVLGQIAEKVDYLPLALEMLAIRLTKPLQTAEGLLEEIGQAPDIAQLEAFTADPSGAVVPQRGSVFATIAGSIDSLDVKDRERLMRLAYTADAPVTVDLALALTGCDRGELGRLLERCSAQSVLRSDSESIQLHALTAAVIRSVDGGESFELALSNAINRLNAISTDDPIALRGELVHHEDIRAFAERILGVEHENTLALRNGLAIGYQVLGSYREAVDLNEETLRLKEKVLGLEHQNTLSSRNNLAINYRYLNRHQEALELDEETLRLYEKLLGPEHPHTLSSRNGLAIDYRNLDRHQDALDLDEETLRLREKVLGPEPPATRLTRNNLANDYRNLDRHQEALDLDEKTLRLYEKVLGPEHPNTLASRNNLASSYSNLDRHQEALDLDEETLRLYEKVLGREHPDTLRSRRGVAFDYRNLDRHQEALDLEEETLRLYEKVLGPEHPDTLSSRNSLAIDYSNLGRHHEALDLDEETLRLRENVLGPEHPDTLMSRRNLAIDYRQAGREEDALRLEQGWRPWDDRQDKN